ncbi:MAG: hypothetical protein PF487_12945 [Bacteroidales bacterium]|nr:hypothetical protein [Bacteroidales bacterium]
MEIKLFFQQIFDFFNEVFEPIDVPKIDYDDKTGIRVKKKGETDRSLTETKSVKDLINKISRHSKPLFRYFLDGSQRTFKVDGIECGKRLYPIIAEQIGVAICEREDAHTFTPIIIKNPLVISFT